MKSLQINGHNLTLEQVVEVARDSKVKVTLDKKAVSAVNSARSVVEKGLDKKEVIYGLTTGFGFLKNVHIDNDKTVDLQENLIRSHAIGFGEPFSLEVVRAAMLIRANSLASGHSGVRLELIETLLDLLNAGVHPYIPEKGSLGASGDLAPLAHLGLVVMGEGECIVKGERKSAKKVLTAKKIRPLKLSAKEGLALTNGTPFMTGLLCLALSDADQLKKLADVAAAMSVETMMGSPIPFSKKIANLRPHPGHKACANNVRELFAGSEIMASHKDCDRVQDSYTLRCIPQVHGACRDAIDYVRSVVDIELNAVTDNPLIFPKSGEVFSGGNFHGEPLAIAADTLTMAIAELANISERRVAKMVDPANSEGLPAFLIPKDQGGVSSGFMIAQYTAAALVAENKVLSHPSSVDSIPTSANQEDHVSMGMNACRHLTEVTKNVWQVIAIELLSATQAADLRKPLKLGRGTTRAYAQIREKVPFMKKDRTLYRDVDKVREAIKQPTFLNKVESRGLELS